MQPDWPNHSSVRQSICWIGGASGVFHRDTGLVYPRDRMAHTHTMGNTRDRSALICQSGNSGEKEHACDTVTSLLSLDRRFQFLPHVASASFTTSASATPLTYTKASPIDVTGLVCVRVLPRLIRARQDQGLLFHLCRLPSTRPQAQYYTVLARAVGARRTFRTIFAVTLIEGEFRECFPYISVYLFPPRPAQALCPKSLLDSLCWCGCMCLSE